MNEFERIARFVRSFRVRRAPFGPGDDCAVIRPAGGQLCVTTDALVEGVHFTRKTFSFEDIGWKALAVNLSDLAAMGARPRWFVCAVAMPASFKVGALDGIARGMNALAGRERIELVGGNFTRAKELTITITAGGATPRPLLRSGAKRGDLLYVSGTLGEASYALRHAGPSTPLATLRASVVRRAERRSAQPAVVEAPGDRQRRPIPRISLGLIASSYASACIDISDGLAQDLGHLCRASRLGARVRVDRLPLGRAPLRFALAGGEDYELLIAVPRARARAFERAARRERVTLIGEFVPGDRPTFLDAAGRPSPIPKGFDHFG